MISVCIVHVPGAFLSAIYGIKDILEYANDSFGAQFDVSVMNPDVFIDARKKFHFVIIPPFRMGPSSEGFITNGALVSALKKAIVRGCIPVSVCAGAYYLCATGAVDGKAITTHWQLAADVGRRFPSVEVKKERVLIDGGNYIAAGGITSFQDLSLHLVRKHISAEAALEVARCFLINPGNRTQLQYIKFGIEDRDDGDIVGRAKAFIHRNLADELSLEAIAGHCGVTVRTLLRRFNANGAGTPAVYLQEARIAHARTLLESSESAIKKIADESGYRDLPSFIRAFRKLTGVAPGEYRKGFYSA